MSPLKTFLLCLAPAPLAILMMALANFIGESAIGLAILFIVAGAIFSGSCVVRHMHRTMEPKGEGTPMKVFLEILVFLGVALAYFGVASAGCCAIAMATMN